MGYRGYSNSRARRLTLWKWAFSFIVVAGIAHPKNAAFTHPGIPLTTNDLEAGNGSNVVLTLPMSGGDSSRLYTLDVQRL